jgi:metal-responsive CopG/Arc/MetJ family transcriptional regulator
MKTIKICLDDALADDLDRVVERLGSTRSDLVRQALEERLRRLRVEEQERCHREGYERHPVRPGEFDLGEDERLWSDGR